MKIELKPESLDALQTQQTAFKAALGLVEHDRSYALTEASERAGGALYRAFLEEGQQALSRIDFRDLLQRMSRFIPTLTQSLWRPGAVPKLPTPWVDPVTGETLRNPWSEPQDRLGQTVLQKRSPALAQHFKSMAANAYGRVADLEDEKQRRDALSKLTYTAQDHKVNIFRRDPMEVIEETVHFLETQPPHVAEVWRIEAKHPVVLAWQRGSENRTESGLLAKDLDENPFLGVGGQLIWTAARIDAGLVKSLEFQAQAEAEAALARAKELKAAAGR